MIQSPGLLMTLLAFVLVIGPLVFVHEMGHYLAARWCGVKIDAFSIGFGREVAGWTDRRGTRWKIGWLPLGGYVKFAGDMNAVSQPSAEWLALPAGERSATFQAKPVWQRAIIVAAGPVVNFAAAILILAGFAVAYGDSRTPTVVSEIVVNGPAATAGVVQNDRILSIGGRRMDTFNDVAEFVRLRPQERVEIVVARGSGTVPLNVVIGERLESDKFGRKFRLGQLGVLSGQPVFVPVSLIDAPQVAIRRTGELLRGMIDGLGQIITGRRSVKELGGPLAIAKISGEKLKLGLPEFVGLIALVSINLGFINLLPVPMLDGGHLLFYAIEAVRRKPVGAEAQEWAYRGGLAAILALMLMVTFNDLGNLGLWRGLAGLIG